MTTSTRIICSMLFPVLLAGLFSSALAQNYVTPDFQVSDDTYLYCQEMRMSVSDAGQLFFSWGTAGKGQIQYKIVSQLGTQFGIQDTVDSPVYNMPGDLVHNGLGNCMILFQGNSGNSTWITMAQTFDPEGKEFGPSWQLDDTISDFINIYGASLNVDRQNQFGACLTTLDSIIAIKLSETGDLIPGYVVLKPKPDVVGTLTGIMTHAGDYLIAYSDYADGNLWGQKFDDQGSPSGNPFQISNKKDSRSVQCPVIVTDTTGRFGIIWNSVNRDSLAYCLQLFEKDGNKKGANILIRDFEIPFDTYYASTSHFSIDMDEDGKCIVAFQLPVGDTLSIYMQQIDNQGELIGGNYRSTTINNKTEPREFNLPSQDEPCVKLKRDTIYLAWVNYNPDLSNQTTTNANIQKWGIPDNTGTEDQDATNRGMLLYPNPSDGYMSLKFPTDLSGSLSLRIFSSIGLLVHEQEIHITGRESRLSLPELGNGFYLIEMERGSVRLTESFVIQH